VKLPAADARHLGDYVITIISRLDSGTAKNPPQRKSTDTQSQRVYLEGVRLGGYDPETDKTQDTWVDAWVRHTATGDAVISGSGLLTTLLAGTTDRQPRGEHQSSMFPSLPVRKPSKVTTTASSSLVEKTVIGIKFVPDGTVNSHDYRPSAQSSLHVHVTGDCFMHQAGSTEHLSKVYGFVKIAGGILESICSAIPKARVDGEVGVDCDTAGLNYRVQQAKPLELVEGTGGSLVAFSGPEVELGMGPVKLGKAAISLKSGANHIVDRHLWLEELSSDHHLRESLQLDAVITTDLVVESTLVTDHGYELVNVIDNGLNTAATSNHEFVVVAAGTVDGHPVGVTLSIGKPAEKRPEAEHSRLRARLAPKANPSGSNGYVEPLGGLQKGLKHPGFALKVGSQGTAKVGEPRKWRLA